MKLQLTSDEILAAIRQVYPMVPEGAVIQLLPSQLGARVEWQDTGNEAGGSPQISGGSQGPAEPRSLEGGTIAAAVDGYLAQKRTEGVSDSHWRELKRVLTHFAHFASGSRW